MFATLSSHLEVMKKEEKRKGEERTQKGWRWGKKEEEGRRESRLGGEWLGRSVAQQLVCSTGPVCPELSQF